MNMKNASALFGVGTLFRIALAAVIGFSMAALSLTGCESPTGSTSKSLTGIEVTSPPTKVQYNLNEAFDPAGMVVTAAYSDGSTAAVTGYETSGFSSAAVGNKTITVTYQGKTATFMVLVIDPGKEIAAKPTASPAAGAVASGTTVALSTSTPDAEIWYTTNGSAPAKDGSGSAKYTTPIAITAAVTIKAIAVKNGMNDSAVLEAAYTATVNPGNQTPVAADFDISGATTYTYDGTPKSVTITPKQGKTTGAITIYYNGSTTLPTAVGTYTVTFNVAAVTGWTAISGLSAGTLTIQVPIDPVAADFDISGTAHTYDGAAKSVTISPKDGKSQGSITVYYDGEETPPINVDTYAITFDVGQAPGYNAVTGLSAGTLTISPKPVTITGLGAANKIYDGNVNATVTGAAAIDGNVDGANLTVTNGTAVFADKNTGNSKTVTFSGYALGGTAATNYTLSAQPAGITANITPLQLTIAVPSGSLTKEYDGTTAHTGGGITIGSLTNVVSGDTVSVSIASATYNNASVTSANQITIVYAISGADAANYSLPANDTIAATITRATGEQVSAPTVASKTYNRITINIITTSNGQEVEYAICTADDNETALSAWQEGTVFTGLNANTTYHVYARSVANDNYETGTASVSDSIVTLQSGTAEVITYYWVNEQDALATTDNPSNGTITLSPGQVLTITAQGAPQGGEGYTNQQWHLNGKNTGETGVTYTFSRTTSGNYTVGLFVEKGGKWYNANFTVTVEE